MILIRLSACLQVTRFVYCEGLTLYKNYMLVKSFHTVTDKTLKLYFGTNV